MKKVFIFFMACALLLVQLAPVVGAAALTADVDYTGSKLVLSGSGAKTNQVLSVYVLGASVNAGQVSQASQPALMEATYSDNAGNFSMNVLLPESFASGLYKVNVSDGASSWESGIFSHMDVSAMTVSTTGGTVSATMPYSKDTKTIMLIGIYDAQGCLVKGLSDSSSDGTLSVSVPSAGGSTYRIYLWNGIDTLQPSCGDLSGNITAR